jgi:hypothetical protein
MLINIGEKCSKLNMMYPIINTFYPVEAGLKNITVNTSLHYDNIYLAKK